MEMKLNEQQEFNEAQKIVNEVWARIEDSHPERSTIVTEKELLAFKRVYYTRAVNMCSDLQKLNTEQDEGSSSIEQGATTIRKHFGELLNHD